MYLLAGQSYMDGYGYQSGLPPAWRVAEPAVRRYGSGSGEFRALAPTSAGGSPYVGPEVSVGHPFLAEGRRVALVKHAVADADPAVLALETRDLPRNACDLGHHDGPSNRGLGQRFAEALMGLPLEPAPAAALNVESYALNWDGSFTVDRAFTLDRPITLTDLGGFAPAGSYLWTDTEVGIWDADTETLLVRDDLPSLYEAPSGWRDGSWYVAIDPVSLPPGPYAIGLVA